MTQVEPICQHKACGKRLTGDVIREPCVYHPGVPVFHEGYKDIRGCTTGAHDPKKLEEVNFSSPKSDLQPSSRVDNVEVYGTPITASATVESASRSRATPKDTVIEQDEDGIPVPIGAKCRRSGCNTVHSEANDLRAASCVFHPGVPIFHEGILLLDISLTPGQKGYTCCKKRVLDFDEFLDLQGCKVDRHLFIGTAESRRREKEEAKVKCRVDFYQTQTNVVVSVFAKKTDADNSIININEQEIDLNLLHMDNKRFIEQINLFGHIDPAQSTFQILGTKVEFNLRKADATSWPSLRAGEADGQITTFGV